MMFVVAACFFNRISIKKDWELIFTMLTIGKLPWGCIPLIKVLLDGFE
jgi:hypothetical protein